MIDPKIQCWLIFLLQIIGYAAVIGLILTGSALLIGITILIWLVITWGGISLGYHRYLSHSSYDLPGWMEMILTFLGILTGQGSSIGWVAMHLDHHAYSDQPRDPHSPQDGWIRATLLSSFRIPSFRRASRLLRSPFHTWIHKHYWPILLGVSLMVIALFGPLGLLCWLAAIGMCWISVNTVNTVNHVRRLGYRNHDTKDNSVNINWLWWLNFGEALHNNHHARPKAWDFRSRAGEIDLSAWSIKWLRKLA